MQPRRPSECSHARSRQEQALRAAAPRAAFLDGSCAWQPIVRIGRGGGMAPAKQRNALWLRHAATHSFFERGDIFSSERLEEATPEGHAATFMSLTFSRKRRNSGGGVRHIVRYVFKKGSQISLFAELAAFTASWPRVTAAVSANRQKVGGSAPCHPPRSSLKARS